MNAYKKRLTPANEPVANGEVMSNNESSFTDKLTTSIKKKSLPEIRELLNMFQQLDDTTQEKALGAICVASDNLAYSMLEQIANAGFTNEVFKSKFMDHILDRAHVNPNFIFIFTQIAKKEDLCKAAPLLNHILQSGTDTFILLQTLIALGKTGKNEFTDTIADFIYYDNNELMMAAINALVQMDTIEAFQRLWEASLSSKSSDHLIEALAKIQIYPQINTTNNSLTDNNKQLGLNFTDIKKRIQLLITMLSSEHSSIKLSISKQLIQVGKLAVPSLVEILEQNPDSAFTIFYILGNIKDNASLKAILQTLSSVPKDPNIRFAAYIALSTLPAKDSFEKKHIDIFEKGLKDKVEYVRMAAFKALDNNLSADYLSKIKIVVEKGGSKAEKMVETIINSNSDNIFTSLLPSDTFTHIASYYLGTKAPALIRNHYTNLLFNRGNRILSKKIKAEADMQETNIGSSVFILSDTNIMLNYIITILSNLDCNITAFTSSLELITSIVEAPPDLVITTEGKTKECDISFIDKLRTNYEADMLPIVLLSSQKKLVEISGVNKIIHMPFKPRELAKLL